MGVLIIRILLGTQFPDINENVWGGVQAVSMNLYHGFLKYNNNNTVQFVSGSNRINGSSNSYQNVCYIKKPIIKCGSIFLSTYPLRISNFLNKNPYDILNAHTIDFAHRGLYNAKKLIYTPHGFKRYFKIMKSLEYVISINQYSTKLFQYHTNAKIFEIANPVADEFFTIKEAPLSNTMLWMGVISRMKNLLPLLKALVLVKKEIKDFTLYLAGKIEDVTYYNEVLDFIKKHDLEHNVQYIGIVNSHKKVETFSNISLFILTSLNEHAPMVISESFASSKPVIASDIGGVPYMVNDGKTGFLIDPLNEYEIAEKILYLLQNPIEMKKMGKEAKQYALKNNRLSTVINAYIKAYTFVYNNQ
jgi:glycosyltransferase involved in cell wall biosynthesis